MLPTSPSPENRPSIDVLPSPIDTLTVDPKVSAVDSLRRFLRAGRISRTQGEIDKLNLKRDGLDDDLHFHEDAAIANLRQIAERPRPTPYSSHEPLAALHPKNGSDEKISIKNARRAEKSAVKRLEAIELANLYGAAEPRAGKNHSIDRGDRRYTRAQRATMYFDERRIRNLLGAADTQEERLRTRSGHGEPRTRINDFRGKGIENSLVNNAKKIEKTEAKLEVLLDGGEPSRIIRTGAKAGHAIERGAKTAYRASADQAAEINDHIVQQRVKSMERRSQKAEQSADNDYDTLNRIENMLGTDAVNGILKRATKQETKANRLGSAARKKAAHNADVRARRAAKRTT